ncbi:hypothetical protein F511_20439 [Dorcoceras hygrometricum]|uniref:Uncharacterized protein n=1 Tax=Dorcoceras hygrometricum TaxID=472368 RepID=A0A2Z7AT08_9LAMI|nr:hypothetical protein F511_20439 [Dorcoceras hygrometricum]
MNIEIPDVAQPVASTSISTSGHPAAGLSSPTTGHPVATPSQLASRPSTGEPVSRTISLVSPAGEPVESTSKPPADEESSAGALRVDDISSDVINQQGATVEPVDG